MFLRYSVPTPLKYKIYLFYGAGSPNLKEIMQYLYATNRFGSLNLYRSDMNNYITNISTHQFVKVQRTVPVCSTKYSQQIFKSSENRQHFKTKKPKKRCRFSEPQKTNQTSQCYKRNRFSEPLSFRRELNTLIRQNLI